MDNLFFRIKAVRPNVSAGEFSLRDDGDGAYIAEWNSGETQPTETELLSADIASGQANANSDRLDDTASQLDRQDDILRAFMLLVLDEVNALRQAAGLQPRTAQQLRNAIRNKLGA